MNMHMNTSPDTNMHMITDTSEDTVIDTNTGGQQRPPLLNCSSSIEELAHDDGQKVLDQMLVHDMTQMSLKDREQVYEEIHGVNQIPQETPEFIQERLEALDHILHPPNSRYSNQNTNTNQNNSQHLFQRPLYPQIAISQRRAYDQATMQNPHYTSNPKLRLMFLRAEYFDPYRAAVRMVAFFEGKLEYFGLQALTRDILWEEDMDLEDRKCCEAGHLQILPQRDQSGRAIFVDFQATLPRSYQNAKNMIKSFIYCMMCLAEDEENQKLGIVALVYQLQVTQDNGDFNDEDIEMSEHSDIQRTYSYQQQYQRRRRREPNMPDMDLLAKGPATIQWLPIRFNAIHFCVDTTMTSILARLLLIGAGSDFRKRSRVHYGTSTECIYHLMTFGFPIKVFPLSDTGGLKTTDWMKWIRRRKTRDKAVRQYIQTTSPLSICSLPWNKVDLPQRMDVLVGKGVPFQRHPGNIALRETCDRLLEQYNNSKKGDKAELALSVLSESGRGRFLKKDSDGWWVEVDRETAKNKVIKAFLAARANMKNSTPTFSHAAATPESSILSASTPSAPDPIFSIGKIRRPDFSDHGSKRLRRNDDF